jgi:DNA processing protein
VPSTPLLPADPRYPPPLLTLSAPPVLHVRGALPAGPGVAIVGTREPSPEGERFARELARGLVELGLAVWSGGARGVDAAAHEGALEAGGVTVLVAGAGLDVPYPREHAALYDRIRVAGGALVARVPDGTRPTPASFLQRNVVLAALTAATVVVEAGLKSGARSTAAAARRLGRPLGVVPHAPWSAHGAGNVAELARGATAVACAADAARLAGRAVAPPRVRARPARKLPIPSIVVERAPPSRVPALAPRTREEVVVLDALSEIPLHVEEICEKTSLPFSLVAGALLTLTLDAVVVEPAAGFYRRARGLP